MVETEVDWEVCYPLGNCVYLVADYVIRWTEGTLQVMKSSRRFCIYFIIIYFYGIFIKLSSQIIFFLYCVMLKYHEKNPIRILQD